MHWLLQALLAVVATVAAITDIRYRRIPNWLTFSALASGLCTHTALDGARGFLWSGLGTALAGLVYLGLYALGAMGGGDVKLMSATGAIAGPQIWLRLFFWALVCGCVLAAVVVLRRRRVD